MRSAKTAEASVDRLEESDETPRSAGPVPRSATIDVSRPRPTRSQRALSAFADVALAVLLVLAIPLALVGASLPFVWLVRAVAGLVNVF